MTPNRRTHKHLHVPNVATEAAKTLFSAPSNAKSFTFMRFPLEIRIMIYKEALIMPGPIELDNIETRRPAVCILATKGEPCVLDEDGLDPSPYRQIIYQSDICQLLNTSRGIRQEAKPIYFGCNSFRFRHLNHVPRIISAFDPESRRSIRSLSVVFQGRAPAKASKALASCIGLRRLDITFTRQSLRYYWHARNAQMVLSSLMEMPGLKDLLKIRGIERLTLMKDPSGFGEWESDPFSDWPEFVQALQVLKKPHTKAQLTRQYNKDFPQKTSRTTFGRANVSTRTESTAAGEPSTT
ncbi:MAG: hypothetical protein Q9164_005521 [Protoblastenia rupestris]